MRTVTVYRVDYRKPAVRQCLLRRLELHHGKQTVHLFRGETNPVAFLQPVEGRVASLNNSLRVL
ncbi:MAG: hypothetical protein M1377_04375 [Deltaproteobacteria bacterium]|nr:hypothetical protein [Deltaproteobacteria bacterium]